MPAGRWAGFILIWVALAVFTGDAVRRGRAAVPEAPEKDPVAT